ncbi:MAG: hypothetical protein KC931_24860, partial [Candidatus Omnitrophica bacterium]|nr:hypothetical protein [Candidatus Omnitrophota bacterium]
MMRTVQYGLVAMLGSILMMGVVTGEEKATPKEKKEKPAARKQKEEKPGLPPTFADVAYGLHDRNVLDFWQAGGDGPRPMLVMIHGGGWVAGDKKGYANS